MPASLSELIQYAQAKAPRNRLADLAATGIEGFNKGRQLREKDVDTRLKRAQDIAELSKTLGEVKMIQGQARLNDNIIKAMGGTPLSPEESQAAQSSAYDMLGPSTKKYLGIDGTNRTTPITKAEKVEAITEATAPKPPHINSHFAEEYEMTPSYQNGKWGLSFAPRSKVEADQAKKSADIELTKQKATTEKLRQDSMRKKPPAGSGRSSASREAALADGDRKMASDMATRAEVARQKAAGTYIPQLFKYVPTEDELLKYLPTARKYRGTNPSKADEDMKKHIDEQDPLGKFHR